MNVIVNALLNAYDDPELDCEIYELRPVLKSAADLIEQQAAELTALRDAIKIKGCTEHYPTEDAYLSACTALEKLHRENDALREATLWIPVSERLPEPECLVLIYGPTHPDDLLGPGILECCKNGSPLCWYHGDSPVQFSTVTHWMPLPSAPKEEI